MAKESAIEWTEATWNPWHGCHKVSQGCKNCYMFREKKQYGQDPNVVVRSKTKFYDPLKWTEPRTIFTCSWSDFFIEEADAWRDEAFAIMALTPQHTYQVLTKRPERMLEYCSDANRRNVFMKIFHLEKDRAKADAAADKYSWPLPNVWLGVSVEDQKTADERIPLLLQTPAAVRWLSIEPLLGSVDIREHLPYEWKCQICDLYGFESTFFDDAETEDEEESGKCPNGCSNHLISPTLRHHDNQVDRFMGNEPEGDIGWVVAGGESGPDARPMHPDWVRSIRDQCTAAGVPYFFKQWGEYVSVSEVEGKGEHFHFPDGATVRKVGKKAAGRILDGRTWDEMPEVSR